MSLSPLDAPFAAFGFPQRLPVPERRVVVGPPSWVTRGVDPAWATYDHVTAQLPSAVVSAPDAPPPLAELLGRSDLPPLRESAVLVVVAPRDDAATLVMTRRSRHLRHHQGELAFPGGRRDEGEGLLHTALREAHEEVGLVATDVQPVGWLTPLITLASQSAIWPLVAVAPAALTLRPTSSEVDDVFELSVPWLLHPDHAVVERWWRPSPRASEDGSFLMTFFRTPRDLLWGASARITDELLTRVTTGAFEQSGE